tara:strand:+ start:394 stop:594 length:201 start_codon:yes stop_codon:yes gene_type:complete
MSKTEEEKILELNQFIHEVGLEKYCGYLRATDIVFGVNKRKLPRYIDKSLENYKTYCRELNIPETQ